MSSSGIGTISDSENIDPRNEAEFEEDKIEKEKETRIIERSNERLKELVPNNEIYEAMENFLLGDPENQIPQLGTPDEILSKGNEAMNKGEDLIARAQYETTAKVAIYQQNRELSKTSLELASKVTNPSDRHAWMQKTISDNLDEVLGIARDYYRTKEKVTAEEEATIASAVEETKK
jgi:hypothetical protein